MRIESMHLLNRSHPGARRSFFMQPLGNRLQRRKPFLARKAGQRDELFIAGWIAAICDG
jgi:hypothetical protein